jgi:hypothetical protein
MSLRHVFINELLSNKTDSDFIDFLNEVYPLIKEGKIPIKKEEDKTPNELLNDIFLIVQSLKDKLHAGEKFIDPSMLAQLHFYKVKNLELEEKLAKLEKIESIFKEG